MGAAAFFETGITAMQTTPHRTGWLPTLNPALAPRVNALLKPGSLTEGSQSLEVLARAVFEDSLQNRITDVHIEPFSQGWRLRLRLDGITQIQVDTVHGPTFTSGLRAMLRLDPDYLLIGEMRDQASAQITIEAASSGHFVMSTMHCPDVAGVVTLLRNWNIPDHQIATLLQIVVNQRLVRRLCPECRRESPVSNSVRTWLNSLQLPSQATAWQPGACEACRGTGYRGRIGVFEIWHKGESDCRLILEHTDELSLRAHLRQRGLKSVVEDGLIKAREGVTSLTEVQQMGAHFAVPSTAGKKTRRRQPNLPSARAGSPAGSARRA